MTCATKRGLFKSEQFLEILGVHNCLDSHTLSTFFLAKNTANNTPNMGSNNTAFQETGLLLDTAESPEVSTSSCFMVMFNFVVIVGINLDDALPLGSVSSKSDPRWPDGAGCGTVVPALAPASAMFVVASDLFEVAWPFFFSKKRSRTQFRFDRY